MVTNDQKPHLGAKNAIFYQEVRKTMVPRIYNLFFYL